MRVLRIAGIHSFATVKTWGTHFPSLRTFPQIVTDNSEPLNGMNIFE